MTFIYPIIFHENEKGRIEGYFPDLDGCRAEGETLELAVRDAMEGAARTSCPDASRTLIFILPTPRPDGPSR